MKPRDLFTTIHTEGGLLPADLLQRLVHRDKDLPGLDDASYHLYGIERDDAGYITDTFPIVKRKDEAQHGEYRTKRVILEIYDAMQQAMDSGMAYRTRLDPPPADPRVAHQS